MKPTMYLCLCAFIFLSSRCQSPLDDLPPETQEGKNTFGFLLNGQAWEPEGRAGLTSNLKRFLEPHSGIFNIGTYKINKISHQYSSIHLRSLKNVGIYQLDGYNGVINFNDLNKACKYRWDGIDKQEGWIEITKYDTKNYIVSGRFEAVLTTKDCEIIKITHGRFDVKFQ
jgi:hypothetical protein